MISTLSARWRTAFRIAAAGALALAIAACSANQSSAPTPSEPQIETRVDVEITPVIVEIARTQERRAANGGSAVVLFADTPAVAERNRVTCESIWSLMKPATVAEVRVGLRRTAGGVEALRPLYWIARTPTPTGDRPSCAERLTRYDFVRARIIRDKYGLTGAGPHLLVARADERAAAVIDLTDRTPAEIEALVEYFRDGFAFEGDIWDPSRASPARKEQSLIAALGARFEARLMSALGALAPSAAAGCPLGDLADQACTR